MCKRTKCLREDCKVLMKVVISSNGLNPHWTKEKNPTGKGYSVGMSPGGTLKTLAWLLDVEYKKR